MHFVTVYFSTLFTYFELKKIFICIFHSVTQMNMFITVASGNTFYTQYLYIVFVYLYIVFFNEGNFDHECKVLFLKKGLIDPAGFRAESQLPNGFHEFKYPG